MRPRATENNHLNQATTEPTESLAIQNTLLNQATPKPTELSYEPPGHTEHPSKAGHSKANQALV